MNNGSNELKQVLLLFVLGRYYFTDDPSFTLQWCGAFDIVTKHNTKKK